MRTASGIDRLIAAPLFGLAARTLLTLPFWWSGFAKLHYFGGAVAEVKGLGIGPAPAIAAATIVVQLAGSALVIDGRYGWLGAGALGIFTALATLLAHAFWTVDDAAQRNQAFNSFLEHIALIAGFMLAAMVTRGGAKRRRAPSAMHDMAPAIQPPSRATGRSRSIQSGE